MKRTFQKLLALTLALTMSIGMSTTVFAAESNTVDGNYGGGEFFGYKSGASLYSGTLYYDDLSEMGQFLYKGLLAELKSPDDSWLSFEVPSSINANAITDEDVFGAYGAIRNEWPELIYWADLGISAFTTYNADKKLEFNYFVDTQVAYRLEKKSVTIGFSNGAKTLDYWTLKVKDNSNDQAEKIAQGVLNAAPGGSDFDKVEYFNNWIIENTVYDSEGIVPDKPLYDNTFQIAGVFVDGKAVCEGYAKAFKYLCDKSNIDCLYVTGTLDGVGHAWNYVKLDGAWYIVDTTNNDVPKNSPDWNRAFCIGSEAPFAQMLVPDRVLDLNNGVWVLAPASVKLNPINYSSAVVSIEAITPPANLEYFAGDELDLTGATVTVKYLDQTEETIPMTVEMLPDLDMNKIGEQTLTVKIGNCVSKDSFKILIKNAPVELTVRNAVTRYAVGVSSLDLSKGDVLVTYSDKTTKTLTLNDEENIKVNLPLGLSTVTGFPEGKWNITVDLLKDVKPLSTTYTITVGNPGGGGGGSSGGGSSHADPSYPSADSGIKTLTDIKKVDLTNLPTGMTLAKTAGNTSIAVIAVSLSDNGGLDLSTISALSKLPANVGLMIKQGKGALEMILPGGFTMTAEPGRFSYPLAYNPIAENKSEMLAAVKTKDARTDTLTIGGNVVLPVKATISVKTSVADGSKLNIYRFDPATKKNVLVGTGKVVGGRIVFTTNTLGQFMITTGTI